MRPVGASNLSVHQWENKCIATNVRAYDKSRVVCLFYDSSKNLKKPILFPIFRYFYLLRHHFTEWFLKDITLEKAKLLMKIKW